MGKITFITVLSVIASLFNVPNLSPGKVASAASPSASNPLMIPPLMEGRKLGENRIFVFNLRHGEMEFLPGLRTPTLGVNGNYLGPTIRVKEGDHAYFFVTNRLDVTTTVHWHGMHIPASMDGGPAQQIPPGETWRPHFTIMQRAALNWYHPHAHHKSGEHTYRGMAGLFIIEDDESLALDIPRDYGIDDVPLVIQDRAFNEDGTFRYKTEDRDFILGMRGDVILVNGTPNAFFQATTGRLRFRILNGSNARVYNLGFDDDRTFLQIGTGGSLLEAPVEMTRVLLGAGERAEIIVDVSDGEDVVLNSSPHDARAVSANIEDPNDIENAPFPVLAIRAPDAQVEYVQVPEHLIDIEPLAEEDAAVVRKITLSMGTSGKGWFVINGQPFDMMRVDETVKLGDIEVWEVMNASPLPHPFHVHDVHFLILDRNGEEPSIDQRGYMDTVLVKPGELVRLIMHFEDFTDPEIPYMYHCHMLEHEDGGMMGQFVVVE